jgi:hypothetical protein
MLTSTDSVRFLAGPCLGRLGLQDAPVVVFEPLSHFDKTPRITIEGCANVSSSDSTDSSISDRSFERVLCTIALPSKVLECSPFFKLKPSDSAVHFFQLSRGILLNPDITTLSLCRVDELSDLSQSVTHSSVWELQLATDCSRIHCSGACFNDEYYESRPINSKLTITLCVSSDRQICIVRLATDSRTGEFIASELPLADSIHRVLMSALINEVNLCNNYFKAA